MAKKYPKPIFKPRELKKLFESQWFVEAEWPDGTIEQPAGPFASDSEARDWIASATTSKPASSPESNRGMKQLVQNK
jgi:hypothetical protein